MKAIVLLTFLLFFALIAADPPRPLILERVGRFDHPSIQEASGMVKSRKHVGVYWVHNDSGNASQLFAVRRDGSLIREYQVNIPNVDWEDIATDNAGHLYIGEIGNNGGRLPLRAVYQLDEPDPIRDDVKLLKVTTGSYYIFAANNRFDAEGLAIDGNRALLVAKSFDGRDAEVYSIPIFPPARLLKPATPEPLGSLPGFVTPVTGASLSVNGLRLAVCGTGMVGIYERSGRASWKPVFLRAFLPNSGQVEAITWDGENLLLAGENREILSLPARLWHARSSSNGKP